MDYIKILVVGDGATDIGGTIESLGYPVPYMVSGGEDAVKKALELMPDIILMELVLREDKNYLEIVSQIQKLNLPVIFLIDKSEVLDFKEEFNFEDIGFAEPYGYLIKPYEDIELKYSIEIVVYKNKIKKELQNSEERYENLFETIDQGVVYYDVNGEIISANPAAEEILGLTFKDLEIGSSINRSFVHEDGSDFPDEDHPSMIALKTGKKVKNVIMGIFNPKIGKNRWIKINAYPQFKKSKTGSYQVFSTFEDITERKIAKDKQKKIAQKLQLALDAANMGWWHYNPITNISTFDEKYKEIFGVSGSESPNDEILKLIHPDDLQSVWEKVEKAMNPVNPRPYSAEYRIFHDKGVRWIEAHGMATFEGEGDKKHATSLVGTLVDITPRKNLENALMESEHKFRELVENAADALFVHDFNGDIVDVNQQSIESLGYTREELLQMNVLDIEQDFNLEIARKEWLKIKPGEPFTLYGHQKRKDGALFPVEIHFTVVEINNEKLIMGLVRDITNIKKAEKELKNINRALRKRDEEFRHFIDSAPVAIAMFDKQMKYIAASLRWIEDYNLNGKEIHGKSHYQVFPEITDQWKEVHKRALAGSIERSDEDEFVRADGSIQCIRWEVHPWYSSSGDIGGIIIFSEDVTERKKAIRELVESEKKYRHVIETASEGIILFDNKGTIIENNPATFELMGSNENLVGKNLIQIAKILNINLKEFLKAFKDILRGKPIPTEWKFYNPEGETRFVKVNYSLMGEDEKIEGITLVLEDITVLKLREIALRENEQFLEKIIENIPDMIFVKTADELKFERVNKAVEQIWGYPRDEMIGKTDYDFFTKDEADFYTKKDQEVLDEKEPYDIPEETIHTRYRGERILHTQKIPLFDEKGHPNYLLGISEDITQRKLAEIEIKRSLGEKEDLLREIHHRVKNNMQIISSLLNLQIAHVEGEESKGILKDSQSRVKAMAMIHEKLYISSDLSHINFKEYVEKLVSDLFYSYKIKIGTIKLIINIGDVEFNMETAIPLGLIINELVTNSLKFAFPDMDKGSIRVELETGVEEHLLIIADDGVGLAEDFDLGKTDSFGLNLVSNLVNQLDGNITFDRSHGTRYNITFKELGYKQRF